MKVMIIVLVAIAVAVVLVLFYGGLRPQGDPDEARNGVEGGLGWLIPRPTVVFEDIAGKECADEDIPGFSVPPTGCAIELEAPSQIILCNPGPGNVGVETRGRDYPDRVVDQNALSCLDPEPTPIRIYDAETTLLLTCDSPGGCTVRLVEEG
ncbi:hypothetical protein ACPW96_19220 [Micromonospora sp. DT81.3]|uniref:hypothetical protein n=1 Tax=Actinomycetes TaxID=1760 RepID=UPI003CEE451F